MKIPFSFKFNTLKINTSRISNILKNKIIVFSSVVILCIIIGLIVGASSDKLKEYFSKLNILIPNFNISDFSLRAPAPVNQNNPTPAYVPQTTQEELVIEAVKNSSPSVVSIIISKNLPVYQQYFINPFGDNSPFNIQIPQLKQKGTKLQEVGGGSGFVVSTDGMVATNKHVVSDSQAEYTVLTNDGKKYPAKVLALDPVKDLAIIQIQSTTPVNFVPLILGDSDGIQIGQSVIAIGNALGEFRNTVSLGVISGLGRQITASGGGTSETLEDVIQTDAAINEGNSGGPLLNLKGEVIGINTATAQGAQSIGFALPINLIKKDIDQVKSNGKIAYPFLGVYYTLINPDIKKQFDLPVDNGAWIGRDQNGQPTDQVVMPNSPAQKLDIQRGDIILEIGGEKITQDNSLAKIIMKYSPGDQTTLKILRGGKEQTLQITIGERIK